MVEQITLYTGKMSPYAQRVELALEEAGAKYTKFEIDFQNKPEWFARMVNPCGKVPAITYGGPDVPPDQPSPDSVKIAESLIIVELIADLFPNSSILPKDPILRAKARFFVDAVSNKFLPGWVDFIIRGEAVETLYEALEALQSLLPDDRTYAVSDDYTAADIAITPFLARLEVAMKNDVGVFKEGEGKKAWGVYHSDRFAKIRKYFETIKGRLSFNATFDEEYIKAAFTKSFSALRAQKNSPA